MTVDTSEAPNPQASFGAVHQNRWYQLRTAARIAPTTRRPNGWYQLRTAIRLTATIAKPLMPHGPDKNGRPPRVRST